MFHREARLLRIGIRQVVRGLDRRRKRRQRTGVREGQAELRHVTGVERADRRRDTQNPLIAKRGEDVRRVCRTWIQKRRGDIRDLTVTVDYTERPSAPVDVELQGRVKDSVTAAHRRLLVAERVPGKTEARREI